jgi:hypothetical protein
MKKFILSVAAVCMLSFGVIQLSAAGMTCSECHDWCGDMYVSCILGGEDERACVADFDECRDDCVLFYCP